MITPVAQEQGICSGCGKDTPELRACFVCNKPFCSDCLYGETDRGVMACEDCRCPCAGCGINEQLDLLEVCSSCGQAYCGNCAFIHYDLNDVFTPDEEGLVVLCEGCRIDYERQRDEDYPDTIREGNQVSL